MKERRRIIAFVLCLAMMVGLLPTNIFADTESTTTTTSNVDYMVFATDRHDDTDIIGKLLTNMEGDIGDGAIDYVGLGGDMVDNTNNYNSSTVLSEITAVAGNLNKETVDLLYASHDEGCKNDAGIMNKTSGLWYTADNCYVYGVIETDVKNASSAQTAAAAFVTWANGLAENDDKTILVLSHYPIHAKRGDNAGAGYWHNALNTVANASVADDGTITVQRNVAFFHGHNHTVDTTEYFYKVGETMNIESYVSPSDASAVSEVEVTSLYDPELVVETEETSTEDGITTYAAPSGNNATANGTSATIYYTYATAGYLTEERGNGQAMLVAVSDDKITFTKYKSDSETVLGTVDRNIVAKPSKLYVTAVSEYTVGDTVAEPEKVEVEYTDGTTKVLTSEEYKVAGTVDTTTAGTYKLTYSYTEGNYSASAEFTVTVVEKVTANTVTADTYYYDDNNVLTSNYNEISATAIGLTGVSAIWNATDLSTTFGENGYSVYDVKVERTVEGEIQIVLTFYNQDCSKDKLYYMNTDGSFTEIENYTATYTAATTEEEVSYTTISFTTTNTKFTVVSGNKIIPTDAKLTKLEITKNPEVTKYFVKEENPTDNTLPLDITGLVVTATYSNETETVTKEIDWNEFVEGADGYSLAFDMTKLGTQDITITYTYEDVTLTTSYPIVICYEGTLLEETTKVSVSSTEPSFSGIKVEDNTDNETIQTAVAELMKNFVAYDITLNDYTQGDEVTVSLPIPEGVTNPVVYYVADDGSKVNNMNATDNGNGTVTFTTNHFSKYVVGDATEIEVNDPNSEKVDNVEVTTTTNKIVYVLTSSISDSQSYLIVNSKDASTTPRYALANNSGSIAATGVTIKYGDIDGDGDSETYIELEDATDELWTVGGSYTFKNGDYYVGYSSNGNWSSSYSLSLSTESTTWSYSNNRVSKSLRSNWNQDTYYLRYNNGWNISTTSAFVYFYVLTEIEVETTTTVSGTYSIVGNPVEVEKAVVEGAIGTLGSTLTFTPETGTATTEDVSTTATYSVVTGGDPNVIISSISGNKIIFTGNTGTALVKVSYTKTVGDTDYTVYNYITVKATAPTTDVKYGVEITKTETDSAGNRGAGKVITDTITIKGDAQMAAGYDLWADVTYSVGDGDAESIILAANKLSWESSVPGIATVDENGIVTFHGEGIVNITVLYQYADGKQVTDTVTFSVTKKMYTVPEDGTADFPEYPNEGAIRYDKTATAVGNFSETGITKVELSMTGVPYTTDNEMDVVIMLDMSTSMGDDRIAATVAATKVFVESIVKNEDGSYNTNRIYVGYFNGDTVYTITDSGNIGGELASVDNDTEYNALIAAIEDEYDGELTDSGTNYDVSLEKCYNVLNAAKTDGTGNTRQQFCVYMSDGGPTDYATSSSNVVAEDTIVDWFDVSASDSSNWTNSMVKEYWSGLMKDNGVTIYSVGLILQEQPTSGPQDYRGYSADQNYYVTSTILTGIANGADYFFNVTSATDTTEMENVFATIAQGILKAAKNVVVQDKIAEEYTMIFDIPTGSKAISGVTNDFYIEVLEYTLDANHERTTTVKTLTKVYLAINSNSETKTYYAIDENESAYTPTFETVEDEQKGYYTTDSTVESDILIPVTVDGTTTTYRFVADGSGTHNMTSGAYASGTIDSTNMSENLVIATPYFCYNAATRMLVWTTEELNTTELALSYFLYLDKSATEIGTANEVPSGAYETNDYATITYTNYLGNACQQVFPVPQMTWNGAQVSYVFYLVNEAGQPINKSGQVVDFANATFVTDVFTENVVWNGTEAETELNIEYLADELLPDAYKIYDEKAEYTIHVYQDTTGASVFDYFIIAGSAQDTVNAINGNTVSSITTTKVYNTKAGTKYSDYGIYSASAVGTKFETTDANANTVTITTTKQASLDYSDTTVAFAVVWERKLVPDTVVVDFGLDVLIDVVANDFVQNTVSGIGVGNSAYTDAGIAINTGVSTVSKLGATPISIDKIGATVTIENTKIRFKQNNMKFSEAAVFYYETPVEYYEGSQKTTGYMHSSVTVIPATTIYYEDTSVFVEYTGDWETIENNSVTQEQDRPGESQISGSIDADNLYGYDNAYTNCDTYSMGGAHKVTVSAADSSNWPTATFTFTGTAFDIISLTSNTTGTITVQVTGKNTGYSKMWFVDNYYGYDATTDATNPYIKYTFTYGTDNKWHMTSSEEVANTTLADGETLEVPSGANLKAGAKFVTFEDNVTWTATTGTDNSLYQIPVIKSPQLAYDTYTVTITPRYATGFDHTGKGSYDFYLDAIRVYNPANDGVVGDDTTINDAYVADGEAYPEYTELRNVLLGQNAFTSSGNGTGIVFIDGFGTTNDISDYTNVGPNNEVYLTKGQSIAFTLSNSTYSAIASVQLGVKALSGDTSITVATVGGKSTTINVGTATDLYYAITDIVTWGTNGKSGVIVITNTSDNMVSLTNLKVTYKGSGSTTALMISEEEANTAVAFVFARYIASAPVEEVFVPETFNVWVGRTTVTAGEKVTMSITTSSDVANVTVNGTDATLVGTNGETGESIWLCRVPATTQGELVIETVAYNSDGLASEAVVTNITVQASIIEQLKGWLSSIFNR